MKSADIREKFLKYFENHGHKRIKSSSLIPAADPTLLFTNAGMNQFKDCFLGTADIGTKRATTSQKCVRAGGKHNDLENVGFTARHHTFFEMLGNFSFGDYFKKDAIAFAWELLLKDLGLPKDKLRVTVFEKDDEAAALWKSVGVTSEITRLGEKDNFWAMGDTGPCGPCTEIYFDWGPEHGCGKPTCTSPACPCGTRFLEIWNLVFMQFNRDTTGKMTPLPKPSVDTGSGLERVAAVLQGKYNNYDTDLFQPIIQAIAKTAGKKYGEDPTLDVSMRVIADHLRSGTFLFADGVTASNEGRGYVLRRILRRAIRHGKKLGLDRPFMYSLVGSVGEVLGSVYPEIVGEKKLIEVQMKEEEERFHETLHRGMGVLDESIKKLAGSKSKILPGDVTFKLYDTFGFPLDLIEVIAVENGLSVDQKGFETLMEKQRSQSTFNKSGDAAFLESVTRAIEAKKATTQFTGYDTLSTKGKALLLFSKDGKEVSKLQGEGYAVFDRTPFYSESGGQVGDKGEIHDGNTVAITHDTTKVAKLPLHHVMTTKGELQTGTTYDLEVDPVKRGLTAINHTATHMLHAALRKVLGERVKQAGSLVDPKRLRFDFTYPRGLTPEEISSIETMVNEEIGKQAKVSKKEMAFDQAIQSGALAFFDDKYGDVVRVIRIGDDKNAFSVELCGGTHLENTGTIEFLKITSESSVASGVRRVEAITTNEGYKSITAQIFEKADTDVQKLVEGQLKDMNLHVTSDSPVQKLAKIQALSKKVDEENAKAGAEKRKRIKEEEERRLRQALEASKSSGTDSVEKIGAYSLVAERIADADPKILRSLVDQHRDRLKEKGVVLLIGPSGGKVAMCVGLTKDIVGKLEAGKLIRELAPLVGGSGGGRPDFAQAGGTNPDGIPVVIEKIKELLAQAG